MLYGHVTEKNFFSGGMEEDAEVDFAQTLEQLDVSKLSYLCKSSLSDSDNRESLIAKILSDTPMRNRNLLLHALHWKRATLLAQDRQAALASGREASDVERNVRVDEHWALSEYKGRTFESRPWISSTRFGDFSLPTGLCILRQANAFKLVIHLESNAFRRVLEMQPNWVFLRTI